MSDLPGPRSETFLSRWSRRKQANPEIREREDSRVNDDLASKFASEKDTPYLAWVRSQGLDIIPANYVPDLRSVEAAATLYCL